MRIDEFVKKIGSVSAHMKKDPGNMVKVLQAIYPDLIRLTREHLKVKRYVRVKGKTSYSMEIRLPVEFDKEKKEPFWFQVKEDDLENWEEVFPKALKTTLEVEVLSTLTLYIRIYYEEGKGALHLPLSMLEKIKENPNLNKEVLEVAYHGNELVGLEARVKEKGAEGDLIFSVSLFPLTIEVDKGEAFFPFYITLSWDNPLTPHIEKILKEIERKTGSTFEQEYKKWGKAETPIDMSKAYIKESPHLTKQKLGEEKPLPLLELMNRNRELRETLEEKRKNGVEIDVLGLDLSVATGHALNAIQTLLYSNSEKVQTTWNTFLGKEDWKFNGYVPTISFPLSEYYKTYGVTKYPRKEGWMRRSPAEEDEARKALLELAKKDFIFTYKRRTYNKGKTERTDFIVVVDHLVTLSIEYQNITEKEEEILDQLKTTEELEKRRIDRITLKLSPIMVDQINVGSFPIIKPANWRQEIRARAPFSTKHVYLFVDLLFLEYRNQKKKKEWDGKLSYSLYQLANTLRMNSKVKSRKWSEACSSIRKALEVTKELNYLTAYEIPQKGEPTERKTWISFTLNLEKFKTIWETYGDKK